MVFTTRLVLPDYWMPHSGWLKFKFPLALFELWELFWLMLLENSLSGFMNFHLMMRSLVFNSKIKSTLCRFFKLCLYVFLFSLVLCPQVHLSRLPELGSLGLQCIPNVLCLSSLHLCLPKSGWWFYTENLICFSSLRNHRPVQPVVQCLKIVVSYILPNFLVVYIRKQIL